MLKPDLNRLLRPRSIAVVGGRQAEAVIVQCQRMGYAGDIWPVHPRHEHIAGLPVYRDIESLPAAPDACFIGVNRHRTIAVLKALVAIGAGGAVCYASGFREADAAGVRLEKELLQAAGEMPTLGPNCYGFINYCDSALLWPDQHGGKKLADEASGVALITQSSNIAINLSMQRRGLPIAYLLTVGNQASVGISDLAMAMLEDARVSALGLHIEGIDSIEAMEEVALKARMLRKPIVVLKVGKSEQACAAAFTHTASLAGSDVASSAFFKRLGIARAESIPVFLETLKLLHTIGPLDGKQLTSMSCSGGEASMIADTTVNQQVTFPAFSAEQQHQLEDILGSLVTVANPLDYHTYIWNDAEKLQQVYTTVINFGFDLNCLVLEFPHTELCDDRDWQVALECFENARKTVPQAKCAVVASLPENLPEAYVSRLMKAGIAAIGGFDECIIAAQLAAEIGRAWRNAPATALCKIPAINQNSSADSRKSTQPLGACDKTEKQLITRNEKLQSVTLDEAQSKALLARYNVRIPQGKIIQSIAEAKQLALQFGYPLALKKLGIAHKTEADGLRLGIQNALQLETAAAEFFADTDRLYLEAMVRQGVAELIIGVVRDPQYGLLITLGFGGILVELLQDTVSLLLPGDADEIRAALNSLKLYPLLCGYRGQTEADTEAAVAAILAVQQFAMDHAASLQELDINPLIVCAKGEGAYAADALIVKTAE